MKIVAACCQQYNNRVGADRTKVIGENQKLSAAAQRNRYAAQSLVRMYIKAVCWESALCVLPEKS